MEANNILQNLKNFLDSEEGKKSMDAFRAKMRRQEGIVGKAASYIDSLEQSDFESKLKRQIEKHDSDYEDKCYKKGYMPHANNVISLLFEAAEIRGEQYPEILDEFDASFGASTIVYKEHYFNWIHGQGTVLRIFNQNGECIFSM